MADPRWWDSHQIDGTLPPSSAADDQILGGFWVGLTGLIITLIGSLQMLFESLLEPRQ